MRVLTADVGNSNIVIGCFDGEKLEGSFRLPTIQDWTPGSLRKAVRSAFVEKELSTSGLDGAILSSVVPEINEMLTTVLEELTGKSVMLMSPTLNSGILTQKYDVSRLGADRIVDMAAAASIYGTPVAVWDLGTATTLSVVNERSEFVGGMISPGVQLSLTALSEHTAQLPRLQAQSTDRLLGTDTASNMISGTAAATGLMIEGAAARIAEELGVAPEKLNVVITGGLGKLVVPWIRRDVIYDPDLLIKGMLTIYHKNNKMEASA